MRYMLPIVLLSLFTAACTTTYDMRIHRLDGKVETLQTWHDGEPPIHSVCKETAADVYGRTLECKERFLN